MWGQTDTNGKAKYQFMEETHVTNADFMHNRELDEGELLLVESAVPDGERFVFVLSTDLNKKSRYAVNYLAATDTALYSVDEEGESERVPYESIERCYVKRNYGNAVFIIKEANGRSRNFSRFTYTSASIFDAAAQFAETMAEGETGLHDAQAVVEAALERRRSYCPKCGRALSRPGAECIYCQSKHKLVKKVAKYVLPHKYVLLVCLVLSGVTTATAMLPPYMTKTLVDDVLPNGNKPGLNTVVIMLLFAYILQYGIGMIRSYLLRVCGDRIVRDLRSDVYRQAQYLPMRFYDKTSTGSVINRISGDTSTIQAFMLRVTQEVVVQLFTLVGIVVIMMSMNWQLTLLSLIPVPFVVMGSRIFGRKIRPYYRKIWRRWSAVTSILTDSLPGIRIIKSFTNEKEATENFDHYNEEWLKTDIKSARITIAFPQIVSFVITMGSLLIWAVGGRLVIESPDFITAGDLVAFISYTSMFYGPVNFFANFNDSYQSTLAAAERILDIIDAEPENNAGEGKTLEHMDGKIEFKNVSFSFDRSKKALSNVTFTIEPGDVVGIVGTTGSGKSTLINLLMRFYDGYDGEILMDGVDIRQIDMEYYRSQIGYVQQEPMMFHDTIFNNISYGTPNASVEEVMHAADVANAHQFVARMPDAYDTVLGERGTGLSGGERQRLSIARAVLKNPSVLFFDEATASVDSETENLIQTAIERLISGRTTIMIAHRLSTLRRANKIIVVDKGEILEMGTPEELLAKKGKYWRLVEIQTMSDKVAASKAEERFE